ncbi:hypothetical protein QOZ80_6BG0470950 [Eleusine coracana subsp. coracana]|nr:hypothetical protein QOZ80_6BG0470950 [Eleusine coracana subsp. coracana]
MAAPWMLLGRVLRVAPGPDPEDADAAAAADDDFSIPVALPPQITVVTANPSAHPDPKYPDRYPYVLAANPVGILVNISSVPFYGVQLSVLHPLEPHLVLLHEFHDPMEAEAEAEVGQAMLTATAERLPPREGFLPIICNLESIGIGKGPIMVTREEGMVVKTIVSELMVDTRSETARIAYWYYPDGNAWLQQERNYPLAAYDRHWVPSGVLLHDDRLWWFDLSWGILSCEVSPEENGKLLFHPLPEGRALDEIRPGIHDHRCIAASGDALRYVEILINEEEGDEEAMVAMWTATPVLDDDGEPGLAWEMAYSVRFAEIWNDDSYVRTGLPRRVPVITAVCPWNPDLTPTWYTSPWSRSGASSAWTCPGTESWSSSTRRTTWSCRGRRLRPAATSSLGS